MKEKLMNYIVLKGFSENTINNYESIYDLIVKDNAGIFNATRDEIISYLSNKIRKKKLSQSYIAQYVSVFNIVIRHVLNREEKINIPRPKMPVKQPEILSYEEVSLILKCIPNIKQKTIIALMYSTGLRVSEAVGLKITDIDSKNKFISVRNAKGGVDRKVMLDSKILDLLRQYFIKYKPNIYLFNGATGNKYSSRSVQQVVTAAAKKAGIKKHISSHSLRHSCFTQLIKNGVDIRSIQKLAGHKQLSTTAAYLQITDSDVLNIKSPIQSISL